MPTRASRPCLRSGCPALVERTGYCPDHQQTQVTLVCGPPMAGKTTYVAERARPGDLVVDFDALVAALSGQPVHAHPATVWPYAAAARDAVLERLAQRRGGTEPGAAWVIHTAPDRAQREELAARLGAEVVVLDVPASECLARLLDAPAGRVQSVTAEAIRSWWARYTQ